MQKENINDKNICNRCKCAYFGEYCPICKKSTEGKIEPKELNSTNIKKKKSRLGLKLFPLFIIVAILDEKLYIKFKDVSTNETIFTAYMSQNSESTLMIPQGKYIVYYVSGVTWYGTEYFFGPDTKYYVSDSILECCVENGMMPNHEVTFYTSKSTLKINKSNKMEFDK